MKRFTFILLSLSLSLFTEVSAQLRKQTSIFLPRRGVDLFEVGVRGGVAYNAFAAPLTAQPGPSLGFDVAYRGQFLVQKRDKNHPDIKPKERFYIGPLIGVGVTYHSSPFVMGDSVIVRPSVTPNGYAVVDTLNIAGRETISRLQVEVPLMMATTMDNVTFNIGLVGVCELLQKQTLSLSDPTCKTFIPMAKLAVNTSILPMPMERTKDIHFHLYASAQLGYEWKFGSRHRLGLQAFVRYDIFRMNTHPADGIGQWSDGRMTMTPYTNALTPNIHYLDAGIRLYYAFATPHRAYRLGLLPL